MLAQPADRASRLIRAPVPPLTLGVADVFRWRGKCLIYGAAPAAVIGFR